VPTPWTYEDGFAFHSPSACSELLTHTNGKLYWIGNICEKNPQSNRPRYPITIGEVNQDTGLLIRDSVTIIDDRQPGEGERMTLSNFHAREDRENGNVLVFLPRFFVNGDEDEHRFTADLSQITVRVGSGRTRMSSSGRPTAGDAYRIWPFATVGTSDPR